MYVVTSANEPAKRCWSQDFFSVSDDVAVSVPL